MSGVVSKSRVFETILPALVAKADALASRLGPNDAEFIYAVMKLLHRIGTSSTENHASVVRLREQYRSVKTKLDKFKRQYGHVPRPPPPPSAGGAGRPMAEAVSTKPAQDGGGNIPRGTVKSDPMFQHDNFMMG